MTEIPADIEARAEFLAATVFNSDTTLFKQLSYKISSLLLAERQRNRQMQIALNDAITFTIDEGGVEFLKAWTEGDFSSIEKEWPAFDMTSTKASGAA